jgi:NAD(P)-dependent dehydrogenase (short-subunit alcohol dehydrogenase family)
MLTAQGRVVMLSGATRGIGRAVLERLLTAGCMVSAGVRDAARLPWLCCEDCGRSRMAATGSRSGGGLEQPGDEVGLGPHVSSTDFPNLSLPDHRHRLVAC